jgi:integrase
MSQLDTSTIQKCGGADSDCIGGIATHCLEGCINLGTGVRIVNLDLLTELMRVLEAEIEDEARLRAAGQRRPLPSALSSVRWTLPTLRGAAMASADRRVRPPKRKAISIRSLIEWNGEPVKRINKAFRSVRRAAGFGADVVPHTLRHTCATWLAQRGVPTWEAAGYLGMTEATFIAVYEHHHPDHQKSAVNAFGSPRRSPDRYNETKRERAGSNVVRLVGKH